MTDFQAALLLPQLKIMTKIRNYRNDLYKSYRKSVPKNIEIFSLFNLKNNIVYRSILKFKNRHKRDLFKKYMLKNKIECKIPLKNFELLHNYLLKDKKKYSNSELICNTTISLPMHLGLNSQKIKYICKKIKSYK